MKERAETQECERASKSGWLLDTATDQREGGLLFFLSVKKRLLYTVKMMRKYEKKKKKESLKNEQGKKEKIYFGVSFE